MRNNRGHARCIAAGLKHILENEAFDYIIPMDGDGEDRPQEIKNFVEKIKNYPNRTIVGERVKRSENFIFKICYFLHKIITFTFTGKFIKFGKKEYYWDTDGELLNKWPDGQDLLNTKAVGKTYQAAHCLYGSLMSSIGDGRWCGSWRKKNDPVLYPINGYEAFDIDYQWQFEIAEVMYEKNNNHSICNICYK